MRMCLLLLLSMLSFLPATAADRAQGTAVVSREAFWARANDLRFDSFDDMATGSYPNGTQRYIDGFTYAIGETPYYDTFRVWGGSEGHYLATQYPKDVLYFTPQSPGMNAFGFTLPPTTGRGCYCMEIAFTDIRDRRTTFYVIGFAEPISFVGVISAEPLKFIRVAGMQVNDLYFASVSVVPEPAAAWMLALGLLPVVWRGLRRT